MASETLRPNGSGDLTNLNPVGDSPNYKCVDESSSDGDTTYVATTTAKPSGSDLYNIEDTGIPAGSTINGVTVFARCRSTSTTYKASFWILLKKSGGTIQQGAEHIPSTTYTSYHDSFTGVSLSDLNGLQIGISIASGSNTYYYSGRCTQVYVVIDYTPPTGAEERSFTFTETMKPSASLYQWQEHKRTFVETIIFSGNLYGWQEHGYVFMQTITPSETVTIWQEQSYVFTETTVPSSVLNLWQEQMYSFVETIKPSATSFHWEEILLTFFEYSFVEPLTINSTLSYVLEHPPFGLFQQPYFKVLCISGFVLLIVLTLVLEEERKPYG